VNFNVLGPLEVVDDGQPVALGQRQQRVVLAMLVLSANQVVSVDRLVSDLWGDHAPHRPMGALHVYISRLRRVLEPRPRAPGTGQVLVRRAPGYVLQVSSGQLDANHFDLLVSDGRRMLASGDPESASRVLTAALALWRGPLLAEFGEWDFVRPAARRLEELRHFAVEQRLEAELALGHHGPVAADLERLISQDPLRERSWELLALALYRSGRQAEAVRALARARVVLTEGLGLELSLTLRRLEQDILLQAPELTWRPPGPQRPLSTTASPADAADMAASDDRPRLVGRIEEMACLQAALASAARGRGAIVAVSGEAGIGKTRLVEELARCASIAGVTTAMALGHDGEWPPPPFWHWVQILRRLISQGEPAVVSAALARRARDLAPVLADVLDVTPVDASAVDVGEAAIDPEVRRVRFYDAVVGFLGQMAQSAPLLLILEDLHWDDAASMELVQLLATQIGPSRFTIVVTHRNAGVLAGHPLVNLLSALARLPYAQFLDLRGLSRSEVGEILTDATGREPEPSLVSAVYDKTAGNPFFVTELSRLFRSETGSGGDLPGVIPHRVRAVIRRRMDGLERVTSEALALASVVGVQFDFGVVANAGDISSDALLQAIESAMGAGLILESPTVVGSYRFSHSIVRDTIYEAISGLRRAHHHARIAEVLAGAPSTEPDHTVALAFHLSEAAPVVGPERGIEQLLRAAELADAALAYEQGEKHLQRARQLLGLMADGTARSDLEAMIQNRLAISATLLRGFADGQVNEAWTKAAALARSTDGRSNQTASLWGTAALALSRCELGRLARIGGQLTAGAEESGEASLAVAGHLALGMRSFHAGRLGDAREHLEAARQGCSALGDRSLDVFIVDPEVYALGYLAWVSWLVGDTQESARLSAESAACGSKSTQPFSLIAALVLEALVAATRQDAELAGRRAQAIIVADRSHDGALLATLLEIWARASQGGEQSGACASAFKEAYVRLLASGWRLFGPLLLGLLARLHQQEGAPHHALAAIDEALAEVGTTGQRFFEAELYGHRAELLSLCYPDRETDARESLARAVSIAREQGAQAFINRAEELQVTLGL
jgi:DNA-binding SARP family transcriptional activator